MSSNDCGGGSEYSEFFTTIRKIVGIPEVREELSAELKDVLAVVESTYLEEERTVRDINDQERRQYRELTRRLDAAEDARNRQFEIVLSAIGSIVLPFYLVSGVFGMNLPDLPEAHFNVVMLATSVCCFILCMLLQGLRWSIRGAAKKEEMKILQEFESRNVIPLRPSFALVSSIAERDLEKGIFTNPLSPSTHPSKALTKPIKRLESDASRERDGDVSTPLLAVEEQLQGDATGIETQRTQREQPYTSD